METETRVIRISVRNLVEFVMRSGDLDNRRLTGVETVSYTHLGTATIFPSASISSNSSLVSTSSAMLT